MKGTIVTINAGTLKQMLFASGFTTVDKLGKLWNVSQSVAEQWLTSKNPAFKAEDFVRSHFEDMAEVVGRMRDLALDNPTGTILVRTFDPEDGELPSILDLPTTSVLPGKGWSPTRLNLAIEYFLMVEHLNPSGAHIHLVADDDWTEREDTYLKATPDTDGNDPDTELADNLTHLRPNADHPVDDFLDQARLVAYLLNKLDEANNGVVLLRSHTENERTIINFPGRGPDALRYNRVLHHVLITDYLEPSGAFITVVAHRRWPLNDRSIVITLPADTPMYAVMHREPDNPYIDLCQPITDEASQTPIEGTNQLLDGGEPLTSIGVLRPDSPLGEGDLGGTGLWAQKSASKLLTQAGWSRMEDWRLSGAGHPVGTTSILPADVAAARID